MKIKRRKELSTMSICKYCGTKINGNYCSNCGSKSDSFTNSNAYTSFGYQPSTPKNVKIKPRYGTGSLLLAGYFGSSFLGSAILTLIGFTIYYLNGSIDYAEYQLMLSGCLLLSAISLIFYLPGIISITARSPKRTLLKTFGSFVLKSLLFIICWGITLLGCLTLVGLFLGVWRLGLWASCPNKNEYTAFINGKKIAVTRSGDSRNNYIYQDANGEYYYPRTR